MRIALDAMGGDFAPGPIVAGAVEAVRDQDDLVVVLVGDQERIEAELAKAPGAPRDRLPIVHASQAIGMDEKPVDALRKKRDNSISKSWGLMAAGDVKAIVSAGNTGAMVASALFAGAHAKMFLPGVRRPGIAAIFPSHQGPIVIIDVGANMNAKAEDLYQYGIMGSIYAQEILGVTSPRIGLLNVGSEDDKGNDLTRATRALFQESPWAARFVGNIEGRDIYEGHVRVIICDGFVGNVLLKAGEGAVEFLFATLREELARLLPNLPVDAGQKIAGSLKNLKSRFEYEEFGGAPLLGIRGACIICHGSSGNRAIKNALRVAYAMAEDRINAQIIEQLGAKLEASEPTAEAEGDGPKS
ncbi:phosphate acyltransferase PlsX [Paludisphaera borealis]|uniref:Phosphate acyltransferase n=1 Tax=Paludisphaera borealis TaxID=1387353 RepID=A0A1U7CQH2_9BACT|nr:phosphate acyltransferase PlsX [Paludisphaera borealis]APW61182.1 Phosphate acyltransferase [Paludisphaera borealis]